MASILSPIIDPILDRIMPAVEKRLDEFKDDALDLLKAQIPIITEKFLALLPLTAATLSKTFEELLVEYFKKMLKTDPDIPIVSDVFDVSEKIRKMLNDATPEGVHIPILSDILKGLGH